MSGWDNGSAGRRRRQHMRQRGLNLVIGPGFTSLICLALISQAPDGPHQGLAAAGYSLALIVFLGGVCMVAAGLVYLVASFIPSRRDRTLKALDERIEALRRMERGE